MPDDVLEHDDGVVHHQAHGQRDAEQRDVVQAVAECEQQRQRADQRDRQRGGRDQRGHGPAQEDEDHQHHQAHGQRQRDVDVVQGLADGHRAVAQRAHLDRRRHLRRIARQQGLDLVDHLHRVGIGLALDGQRDGALALVGGVGLAGLDAVLHLGHIPQQHRRAIARGHHDATEFRRVPELAVGLDGQRLAGPVEHADRRVGIGRLDRRLQLVERDIALVQQVGAHLDAHGVALLPIDRHLGHAVDRGQPGRQQVLGIVVQLGQVHRRRGQRHQQHRCIGRVDFAIARWRGHLGRQGPQRPEQRGLHIHGRGVDVARRVELQRERGVAQGVGGRDGLQAGDGGELLLQRQRHRRGHRLRRRTGQRRADIDDRRVVGRQGRHRDAAPGRQAGDDQRQVQQHGHHRPPDEQLGESHARPSLDESIARSAAGMTG
mmetsp:Transcript_41224/g.96437  ORF Transcript_41224/g.96437 Transcript_41224/m.96437 type:complete len:432 (-) Transcript_41224:1240-2535(-)